MTTFPFNAPEDISLFVYVSPGAFASCTTPPPPSNPSTYPVDEDVSWQSGGGVLQAAKAVHHAAVVKGQRDLCQTAPCTTEQDLDTATAQARHTLMFVTGLG